MVRKTVTETTIYTEVIRCFPRQYIGKAEATIREGSRSELHIVIDDKADVRIGLSEAYGLEEAIRKVREAIEEDGRENEKEGCR